MWALVAEPHIVLFYSLYRRRRVKWRWRGWDSGVCSTSKLRSVVVEQRQVQFQLLCCCWRVHIPICVHGAPNRSKDKKFGDRRSSFFHHHAVRALPAASPISLSKAVWVPAAMGGNWEWLPWLQLHWSHAAVTPIGGFKRGVKQNCNCAVCFSKVWNLNYTFCLWPCLEWQIINFSIYFANVVLLIIWT